MITKTHVSQVLLLIVMLVGSVAAVAPMATAQSLQGSLTVTAYLCPAGMTPETLEPDECTATTDGVDFVIVSMEGIAPILTIADATITDSSFNWVLDSVGGAGSNYAIAESVIPAGYTSYEISGDAVIVFTEQIQKYEIRVGEESPAATLSAFNFAPGNQSEEEEETPVVGETATAETTSGRPAHVHGGTCDRLAKSPRYDLADLTRPEERNSANSSVTIAESSITVISVPFDELIGSDYAIDVREGRGNNDGPLVCGEIGGPVRDGGSIIIGLRQVDASGFTGIAQLVRNPNDPSQTQVTVFIAETGS